MLFLFMEAERVRVSIDAVENLVSKINSILKKKKNFIKSFLETRFIYYLYSEFNIVFKTF